MPFIGLRIPGVIKLLLKINHKHLLSGKIAVLEGLFLKDVPKGEYFLIALPLKTGLCCGMKRCYLTENRRIIYKVINQYNRYNKF